MAAILCGSSNQLLHAFDRTVEQDKTDRSRAHGKSKIIERAKEQTACGDFGLGRVRSQSADQPSVLAPAPSARLLVHHQLAQLRARA